MSSWKPKAKRKGKKRMQIITKLQMSDGRIVTDPEEVNRLLRADGFTVDEHGNVGLIDRLRYKQ